MSDVIEVLQATWPAQSIRRVGPWAIREGRGGGSRVSAATLEGQLGNLADAESAMQDLGQPCLFMVRPGEDALDVHLDQAGYQVKDPTVLYAAPIERMQEEVPPVTSFSVWPPLQSQKEIWAEGGIGPARLAVMARANGPKTTLMGRLDDTPAATLYAAIHDGCAMVHAVEVAVPFRGRGLGRTMMNAAARWAQSEGAATMALATTRANVAANALYTSLGMALVGQYHYRIKT